MSKKEWLTFSGSPNFGDLVKGNDEEDNTRSVKHGLKHIKHDLANTFLKSPHPAFRPSCIPLSLSISKVDL